MTRLTRAYARRILDGLHTDLDDIGHEAVDTTAVVEHIAQQLYHSQEHLIAWETQRPEVHARYRVVAATALNAVIDLVRAAQAPPSKEPRPLPILTLHHNASYDILANGRVKARYRFDAAERMFEQRGGRLERIAWDFVESIAPRVVINNEKPQWYPIERVTIAA